MNYTAKDYRRMGMDSLKGSWGIALVAMLIFAAISGILSSTVLGTLIVYGPLCVGLSCIFLAISRYHHAEFESFFNGFKTNILENILAGIFVSLFTFLWSLLLIIPGIIKSISYSMTFRILADNPQMKWKDAMDKSEQMMNGHKMEYFLLQLSFIGWILLTPLTCGLLALYVSPYIEATNTAFYRVLAEGENSQTDWQTQHDFTKSGENE